MKQLFKKKIHDWAEGNSSLQGYVCFIISMWNRDELGKLDANWEKLGDTGRPWGPSVLSLTTARQSVIILK